MNRGLRVVGDSVAYVCVSVDVLVCDRSVIDRSNDSLIASGGLRNTRGLICHDVMESSGRN